MSGILIRNLKPENIKQGVEILNVKGIFEGGGSATVNNQDITVDSSIVEQSFTAGEGYTGLGTVNVNPYTLETKSVDSSTVSQTVITDKGLSSVTVNPYVLETKSVDSSTVSQTITSDAGMSSVTVNPYVLETKSVDSSTVQQTITSNEDGLSSVTVNPYTLESKTVDSSTVAQLITPDNNDGLSSVTVNPYVLDSKTVDSSTVSQTVTSSEDGLSSVTVNPYTLEAKTVDSSTVSQTVTSQQGMSSVTVNPYTLDSKTVDSSTVSQTVNSSEDGLSSVTVNPYTLGTKTVDPSTSQQTVVTSTYDGMSSVTVNAITSSIDPNIQAGNIKQGETILGVTGTFDGQGTDWILDAKNTVNAVINSDTEGLSGTNYGMMNLFESSNVKTAVFTNTTATAMHSFNRIFKGDTNLQTVSFPNLTSVTGSSCFNLAFESCSGLQSISFPALTTITGSNAFYRALQGTPSNLVMEFPELQTINGEQAFGQVRYGINGFYPQLPKLRDVSGNGAFANFFENGGGPSNPVPYELPELRTVNGSAMGNFCISGRGGVSSLSLPKLEEINRYGSEAFQGLSARNSGMRSISMPKLQYCNGSNVPFRWMWQSVSSSPGNTITTTPEFFKYTSSSDYGIQAYLGTINLVTDGYTYLGGWHPNTVMHLNFNNTYVNNNDLTDANILHILTKLGEVTDYDQVNYQVNFTSRTIQDTADLDYTNAIAKLTDAGWTVTGLTITT